jgi:Uri superfamily endonuclease
VLVDILTPDPGAYALIIDLDQPLALDVPRKSPATLAPGRYVYCGSAYGPGGMRARVARHCKRQKAVRWHIDRLTMAGRVIAVHGEPGGQECDLVDKVLATPEASIPAPGFGSTDCRRCPSHLIRVSDCFGTANHYQFSNNLQDKNN